MKDYSIIDFRKIEIVYETGTKINGIYEKITAVKDNVLKCINMVFDFRYNPMNGYAVMREVIQADAEEVEHIDYHLFIGEYKVVVKDDDTVTYEDLEPDLTNYLKFTDDAIDTLSANPDKTYKLVPSVTESGIFITVEEVTDETTPETPENEGGN